MPIPLPPRTPTPTSEEEHEVTGLGLEGVQPLSGRKVSFDTNALSPLSQDFPSRFGSMSSPLRSPGSALSPSSALSPGSNASNLSPFFPNPSSTTVSDENIKHPFNFETVSYTAGALGPKSVSELVLVSVQVQC